MKHYQLGLYEKAMPGTLSWREKLKTAKRAGFDFVEISIDESDEKLARLDMSTAERMALVREMSEGGPADSFNVFKRTSQISAWQL